VEEKQYDGQILKEALKSAESLLESRIDEINSLNVFPVPDGDTGINMYLTLQSATEAVKDLSTTSAAEISSKAAMGALMGARGNSGVILSQILRGLAKGMEMKEKFSAFDFAQALHHASDTAYKAITEPVEGTILTVMRETSEAAVQKTKRGADLQQTLTVAASQAKKTVIKTPEMLRVLKEAGVVDAGGKGLFYVFLGMKNCISQKMTQIGGHDIHNRKAVAPNDTPVYGFDLQFLVEGRSLPIREMRNKINSMGESVLVVGDESLIRIHIHTKDPQVVMDYCSTKGTLKDIVKENLDEQVKAIRQKRRTGGSRASGTTYPSSRARLVRTHSVRLKNQTAGT
jgi:DAK2 domain fusion protein YloV